MLLATSETSLGSSRFRSTLVFERDVRAAIVRREHLAYDTRFAAAIAGRLDDVGHVFLVVEGRVTPSNAGTMTSPVAFVLADDEIERIRPPSRTFRTDGDRVSVVHLRFARAELVAPIGIAAGALTLSETVWDAARKVLAYPEALPILVEALAAAGVIRRMVTFQTEEPANFRRLWAALQPLYSTYGSSLSLKQLATTLGMSTRQVGRDAKDLAATFGIGRGFRDMVLVLRLRLAVMLLSAPDATPTKVAETVGYGSPIALARAFRDARLPPPTVVQSELRAAMHS